MKASIIVKSILDKVGQPLTAQQEELLQKCQPIDLPDSAETLLSSIDALMTETHAKSNRGLSEYFQGRFVDTATKTQISQLAAQGYSDDEISEIIKHPLEARTNIVHSIVSKKEAAKYSQTETERIRAANEEARREKERADKIQATARDREDEIRRTYESQLFNVKLRNHLNTYQIDTHGMSVEDAYDAIMNKIGQKLDAIDGRLVTSGNTLRLVQRQDPTLDLYDSKNNRISADVFIQNAIGELNFMKKANPSPAQSGNISNNVQNIPFNPKNLQVQQNQNLPPQNMAKNKVSQTQRQFLGERNFAPIQK